MNYRLECVWKNVPDAVREEAIDFWLSEGAIKDREQARLRADHLLVIARDGEGRIAAVSTAYKDVLHRFGFTLFSFQMFVAKKKRHPGSARKLVSRAWHELNSRFQSGEDRDCLGMIIEVANEKAMRVLDEPVWNAGGAGFVYVGKSARGFHLRIAYFDNARIPI